MVEKAVGFVFPGQGSQSVGMLSDMDKKYSQIEGLFAEASSLLGYDLWKLIQQGPAEELDQTVHTQPALLVASYALWQIIQAEKNIHPVVLAGHSLGEYTALTCANAITFADAVRLVAARAQYMQDAAPIGLGSLAAIVGLDDLAVETLCNEAIQSGEVLTPVNYNSPGQVVVGGHKEAVERVLALAKAAGARLAKLLPVSVPSHCVLMKPAADRLAEFLQAISIQSPVFPVLNNVDVTVYYHPEDIRKGLIRQLFMPVRWVETIKKFGEMGVQSIVECGPGKVLSGLNKRILPQVELLTVNDIV